jgi:crotonobetainyl-CoA:carnitine CoA-transferase CaiB-like acyl-CoA transferase
MTPREDGKRPLDGIRVADFSWFGAGPIVGRTLADFGAEVVRIESEYKIDALRLTEPVPPDRPATYNTGGFFNNFNAGKHSFLLNMNAEGARDVAYRLVERSDVFLTNHTPRVVAKWGVDYPSLRAVNPRIIAAYQPMQGATGPHRDFLGFGAVLTPISGLSHLSGDPARPPIGVGTNYPDFTLNPGHTMTAILAALRHRERTGAGQMVELAQIESVAATLGPALLDYTVNGRVATRTGNRSTWMAPHGVFRCRDQARSHPAAVGQNPDVRERWIAIAVRDDDDWAALCAAAPGAALAGDARFATFAGRKRHEDALESAIAAWTAGEDAASLQERLQGAGVPAHLVQDAEDMLNHDPHLRARGYYRRLEHPETGLSAYDGPVVGLGETPGDLRWAAPLFGEHTYEVATRILGYSDDEVSELVAAGVLA